MAPAAAPGRDGDSPRFEPAGLAEIGRVLA
jgi:hypothetical protein